jgi:hypothetical protein
LYLLNFTEAGKKTDRRFCRFWERGVSKMTILLYLRKLLDRCDSGAKLEYVREPQDRPAPVKCDQIPSTAGREMENEFDLMGMTNLEDYARQPSLSKKSIEQWISSGLLMPGELKVAEKLIKIMSRT